MTHRFSSVPRMVIALATFVAAEPLIASETILIDGKLPEAALLTVDTRGVIFETDAGEQRTPWNQLVRWGTPADPPPRPRVRLSDGSEIVAAPAWTRAGSVTYQGDAFTIRSAALNSITAPRAIVATLLLEAARDPELMQAYRRSSAERPAQQDEFYLADGDVLSGELTAIAAGEATISLAGEAVSLPLNSIAAIRLAAADAAPQPLPAPILVGLADGSVLQADRVEVNEKTFTLQLANGLEAVGRKRQAIVFVQPLGSAVYLSDLAPLDYRHTPYAGIAWPLGRDTGLLGGPLRAGGRKHTKGLAMHSPSRVVYRLTPGEHSRLQFSMAIDEAAQHEAAQPSSQNGAGQGGSVVYRVLVAKQAGFEQAFVSGVVRSGEPPLAASVEIAGARAIALIVEPADFGDRLDHALWLDARLVN